MQGYVADGDVNSVQYTKCHKRQVVCGGELSGHECTIFQQYEPSDSPAESVQRSEGVWKRKVDEDTFVVQGKSKVEAKVKNEPKGE